MQGTAHLLAVMLVVAACAGERTTAPTADEGALTVTSSAAVDGTLPTTYTCDGAGESPPLAWSGAPPGTVVFAMIMSTIPVTGPTKHNWVLYDIPAAATSIGAGTNGGGTVGFADDGAGPAYAPPCSQGPGLKSYTFTVYALSARPDLSGLTPLQVNGPTLRAAVTPLTLASGALTLTVTR